MIVRRLTMTRPKVPRVLMINAMVFVRELYLCRGDRLEEDRAAVVVEVASGREEVVALLF